MSCPNSVTSISYFNPEFSPITLIALVSLIVAIRQSSNAIRQRQNSEFNAFLDRSHKLQDLETTDKLRENASHLFGGSHVETITDASRPSDVILERSIEKYIGDKLNLIYQLWIITGKPKKFRGDYSGWERIAKECMEEIYSTDMRPDYYVKARTDVQHYLNNGRFYSPKFIKHMKQKLTPTRKSIYERTCNCLHIISL